MHYLVMLIGLLLSTTAFSQTNTWVGGTDTDWHKACNWSLNLIPTCAHDVVIPNTTNKPKVTAIAHCKTIDVQSASGALLEVVSSGGGIVYVSSLNGGACSGTATDNGGCCTTYEWLQTSNPSSNNERANDIVVDASSMYISGEDAALGVGRQQWRIEKRDLATGALVAGFGTGGVQLSNPSAANPDQALGLAIDATGIYVCGYNAITIANTQWYIEKRNLTTGALIAGFGTSGVAVYNPTTSSEYVYDIATNGTNVYAVGTETTGGTSWHIRCLSASTGALQWAVNSNPSAGADLAQAVTVDASGVFIAGSDATTGDDRWRIEKRSLTSPGGLIAAFGSGGIVTSDYNTGKDYLSDLAVDATGLYVLGYVDPSPSTFTYQWRIEKRNLTTGALIGTFGTSGAVMVDPSTGYDAAFGMSVYNGRIYVVGYDQTSGTRWRTQTFNATTGASICAQNPGTTGANCVAANASGAFAAGWGTIASNEQWKIIKLCTCP